jgi:hypothetical protein
MAASKSRSKANTARPTTVAAYLASLTPEKRTVIEEPAPLSTAFKKAGKRLDMGKCCLHFKQLDDLELISVATVIAMSTPEEYIAYYKRVKGLA